MVRLFCEERTAFVEWRRKKETNAKKGRKKDRSLFRVPFVSLLYTSAWNQAGFACPVRFVG